MTKEQIKLVNDLQEKIDKLQTFIDNNDRRDKKYDGSTESTYSNYILLHIYPNGDKKLPLFISRKRHNDLLNIIVDTMQAELDLLIAERDSYILSKPV